MLLNQQIDSQKCIVISHRKSTAYKNKSLSNYDIEHETRESMCGVPVPFILFGNGTLIFLKLSSHKWDFSLSMPDIYRAVSNVVTGPIPTISIKGPGNPIYELLYEFKLHCHLLGNLSIRSPPFWQWFQISRNGKH